MAVRDGKNSTCRVRLGRDETRDTATGSRPNCIIRMYVMYDYKTRANITDENTYSPDSPVQVDQNSYYLATYLYASHMRN